MNKILSLIVIIVALVWTWSKVHTAQAVSFETHSGIQMKLAELIRHSLSEKLKDVQDIRITKIWTEAISTDEIKAIFSYEFSQKLEDGEKVKQTIAGEAFLHRGPGNDGKDTTEKWTLERVVTAANEMSFNEGIVVSAPEAGEATQPAATAPHGEEKAPEPGK